MHNPETPKIIILSSIISLQMKTFVTILLGLCQFVTLSRQVVSKKHADDKFGVFDQENKRESVLLDKELETLILNQLDSKINDLEDIKVDAKILERHLDKHSNFSGYQSTRKTLSSIENDLIKAYQKELSMLKRKIIASNHKLGSKDMKEINRMIDNAEITVENSRDMIDSFIDVHLSSEEHEHEHDHEGDDEPHDDFADYSDLITNNTEATKDEEKILLDTINQELEELTDIEIHKEDLNDHLQEHQFIKLKDDEDAKAIIDQVSNEDIHKYKETLLEMRNQIKESKGHLNLEFVDKVVSMLDRANIFVEISKDRLVNADQLDLSNDINSIVQNMDETRELMDDGEHYDEVTGEEYLADEQNEEGIAQADIDDVVSSLDDSLRTEEKSLETDGKVSASEVKYSLL